MLTSRLERSAFSAPSRGRPAGLSSRATRRRRARVVRFHLAPLSSRCAGTVPLRRWSAGSPVIYGPTPGSCSRTSAASSSIASRSLGRRSTACSSRGLPAHPLPRLPAHRGDTDARAGVHPRVVAERLGHATPALVMNVSGHVTERMQEKATAAMDPGAVLLSLAAQLAAFASFDDGRIERRPLSLLPWRGGRAVECGGLENR
jgi:integrase